MIRRSTLACFVVLCSGWALAQQTPYQEELRFVRELRARHYNDLALEYLGQLATNPSPELKRELPLEFAKTRLEAAADEPDTTKRLTAYAKAQAELENFLKDNKGHPRSGEVTLDLAQVAVMRGRTQLSRALLQESPEAQRAEGTKSRELLATAGVQLKRAAAELDRQIAAAKTTTPDEIAAKKKLEAERHRADLSMALNQFDQGQTYIFSSATDAELQARGQYFAAAEKAFDQLSTGDVNDPVTWLAVAWSGRCITELGLPAKKALDLYDRIRSAGTNPAATDAKRLAGYFRLLALRESSEPMENGTATIINEGRTWLAQYPGFAKTPEGYGVRYVLAQTFAARAKERKVQSEKIADLEQARQMLREIEGTENDFTDRAKRLKINVIALQGGFTRPVAELKNFDDCLVRAQFEVMEMGEDARTLKGEELEKKRKQRVETVLEALRRGLALPDGKKSTLETNNARAMYSFYALNSGKYQEAIRAGEEFARSDPKAAAAAMSAMYALEAYTLLLAERERAFATPEELKEDREKMLALARYMEERWPTELAGDLARHQIALLMLRDKEPNYAEAVRKLEGLNPTYPSYALAQFQLAEAAFKADKEKVEPIPGDKAGYRKHALDALDRIPEPAANAEPIANRVYLEAKVRLARELFPAKKFAEMQKMAEQLRARAATVHTDADPKKDEAVRNQLIYEIDSVLLYAKYGLAEAAFTAAKYQDVANVIDPLVKDFNGGKLAAMRKNVPLGMALLGMALKADVQVGNPKNTQGVLQALQSLSAEGGAEAGASTILSQLAVLIGQQVEVLRKKNNEEDLKKAVTNYSAILDEIVKTTKSPSPKFVVLLARCYSNLDQHKKAADLLEAMAEPKQPGPDLNLYRGTRLLLVRELRVQKETDKARKVLEEIIGTKQKPGWGLRSIEALKERLLLEEDEGKYAQAALESNALVKQLLPKISSDNAMKEHYLECYYHITYCFLKHAQGIDDPAKKDKLLKEAAAQIVQLEKKWEGFGSESSKKRFEELLGKEPQLKEEYDKLKAAK
jgi:hypothetical protein